MFVILKIEQDLDHLSRQLTKPLSEVAKLTTLLPVTVCQTKDILDTDVDWETLLQGN